MEYSYFMLRSLRLEVSGLASTELRREAENDINEILRRLIFEALSRWSIEKFSKFADDELSYSVRLFHFCDVAIDENGDDWPIVHVLHDALQPSYEMLMGLAHPSLSPRPDFTVVVGRVKLRLEAKRLRLDGGLPALYVRQGMARFLDDRYRSKPPFPGIMIGYIESDTVVEIIARVNEVVITEPAFGESHVLRAIQRSTAQPQELSLFESRHSKDLSLEHYEIDVSTSVTLGP